MKHEIFKAISMIIYYLLIFAIHAGLLVSFLSLLMLHQKAYLIEQKQDKKMRHHFKVQCAENKVLPLTQEWYW